MLTSGYSRFPIHMPGQPGNFLGLLLIKKVCFKFESHTYLLLIRFVQLLVYDPSQKLPISAFPLSVLPEAAPSINCFQALDYFQSGRSHLLLISNHPGKPNGAVGVVTLEGMYITRLSSQLYTDTLLERYYRGDHFRGNWCVSFLL